MSLNSVIGLKPRIIYWDRAASGTERQGIVWLSVSSTGPESGTAGFVKGIGISVGAVVLKELIEGNSCSKLLAFLLWFIIH
jgi:hypothetical protein